MRKRVSLANWPDFPLITWYDQTGLNKQPEFLGTSGGRMQSSGALLILTYVILATQKTRGKIYSSPYRREAKTQRN